MEFSAKAPEKWDSRFCEDAPRVQLPTHLCRTIGDLSDHTYHCMGKEVTERLPLYILLSHPLSLFSQLDAPRSRLPCSSHELFGLRA